MDKGIQFGRKQHTGTNKALTMIRNGAAAREVINATSISRATYFRLKKSVQASAYE
jgi:hypothetical protein